MTSQRTRDRLVARLREAGVRDERVLEVIRRTPRHLFVDEALSSRAYEDTALPIGFSQTISQPLVVARMTEALLAGAEVPRRVLEIGTGSGYQAAILAQLVEAVYAMERIDALAKRARDLLRELGYRNVRVRHADGATGWRDQAPFDGILVAAAADEVPAALLEQLSVGGRLVMPVGSGAQQELVLIVRTNEHYERYRLGAVSFVPFVQGVSA
jgi:protein-L-isoaspartate(D-aspartate) O-methyltransferase